MLAAKIPFVDVGDITDVVSKVITDDAYNGQTITVTGPPKRTFKEVITQTSNRSIQFVPISIDDFKEDMQKAGLPDSYVWLFGYLFKKVAF